MDEKNNENAINTDQNGSPDQITPPPGEKTYTFRNTYLGAGLMGAALIVVLIAGFFTLGFYEGQNMLNILFACTSLFAVAFATALTSRAKGPDMSIGAMIAISSVIIALVTNATGSWVLGLLIAVAVCAVLGAINGALIVFLKIPSVILTLVTGMAASALLYVFIGIGNVKQEKLYFSQISSADMMDYGALIFIPATFIIAFVIIWLTKLGVPSYKRDKKDKPVHVLAYIGSAVIGAAIGLYAVASIGVGSLSMGSGYELFIIFAYAAVISTRAADNRFFPAVYALAPALVWGILQNIIVLGDWDAYYRPVAIYGSVLLFLVVAYISRYERKPKAPEA